MVLLQLPFTQVPLSYNHQLFVSGRLLGSHPNCDFAFQAEILHLTFRFKRISICLGKFRDRISGGKLNVEI